MRTGRAAFSDYTFSMSSGLGAFARCFGLLALLILPRAICSGATTAWRGLLRDSAGKPIAEATIVLRAQNASSEYTAKTSSNGDFSFADIPPGTYALRVTSGAKSWSATSPIVITEGALHSVLELSTQEQVVRVLAAPQGSSSQASGGEHLSSEEVSSLPLNERDFSKLLLLAAGTMTDTNGAANFTQQFAVNGQRGVASVFALDGADTTDPELGGATFANFNVDAIQEVQSSSGVMPPEIGHGAAGFVSAASTN